MESIVPTIAEPMAEARDVHFTFGARKVFDGLTIAIPRQKVTVIMGPSGCGKSTLLGLLGGRLRAKTGQLLFDGEPLPTRRAKLIAARKKMGMLFQNSALLTDLSVYENVAFPLREQTQLAEPLIRIVVLMKLHMVGLRGASQLMPAELSGGMARRVALARAMALDPQLIMYDEPFVGLDPVSMGIVMQLIRRLNDAMQLTSLVVTHDVAEGFSIADYVYLLDGGGVAGHGTPEQMRTSDKPGIRQFVHGLPDGPVAYHYPAADYAEELAGRVE